jgi:hypothetical protein
MQYQIALVQANDSIGGNIILPLAAGVLWSAAQMDTDNISKWILQQVEYKKQSDIAAVALELGKCDVVSMSTYSWNLSYHVSLARAIKKENPDCFILFGGPEISENSNIWEQYADIIDLALVGEGDESFSTILKQWPDLDLIAIPGAWTPDHYIGQAPRVTNLANLPSPYLTGFYDDICKEAIRDGYTIQAVLQTNRGCPYHCSFCEEGKEYKNKMHFFDEQRIRDEITWFGKNQIEFLSIADDNWGITERDVSLMQHICDTKLKFGFPNIIDATYAKNAPDRLLEMARIDQRANTNLIRGLTIALQSLNEKTLTAIQRFNLVEQRQVEFVKELKKFNIPTYVELIWPLPYETLDSFCAGIDRIINDGTASWIGMYPLQLMDSAQLYDDHLDDYIFSQQGAIEKTTGFHVLTDSIPMASKWANHKETVEGHVVYGWTAVLYYFGYGRRVLTWLQQNRGLSVTDSVRLFRQYLVGNIATIDQLYSQFWSCWLQHLPTPALTDWPQQRTQFWYPYTHLASFVQQHHAELCQNFDLLLSDLHIDVKDELIYNSWNDVVRYQQTYPYCLPNGDEISISHVQPEFSDPIEFSQFYYWWNRKKGLSLITLDK